MRKLWIPLVIMVLSAIILSACGGAPASDSPADQQPQPSGDMQHSPDPMLDTSYDIHFIDSTLDHHLGVITMAEQALKEGTTVEIKDLAQQTMTTAQKEIEWLKAYRQQNHPNAAVMQDNMDMGAMGISTDASKSFDQRYAEAMIAHHQGSIAMAQEALTQVGHDELKQFVQSLISGEQAEITQLQQFIQ
jgi:uncharacterized protein (DUF305 family)